MSGDSLYEQLKRHMILQETRRKTLAAALEAIVAYKDRNFEAAIEDEELRGLIEDGRRALEATKRRATT